MKACVAKLTQAEDFPPPRKTVEECYTHDMNLLVKSAGLTADLVTALVDRAFKGNWYVVLKWSEGARYATWTETNARELWGAITDPTNGVLQWVKSRW